MVSEHVRLFLQDFPGVVPGPRPDASLERDYGERLPRTMIDFMLEHGFSGFGRGLFWLVDPRRWQPMLESFVAVSEPRPAGEVTVFGRTAFGALYAWSPRTGLAVFSPATGLVFLDDASDELPERTELVAGSFFSAARPDSFDLYDEYDELLFDRAYDSLGQLTSDQVYGFFPPPTLGGKALLENLRRVDAMAHLSFLT